MKIYENKDLNITGEIWKPIKNYEGIYEVSNLGRIKTLERVYLSAIQRYQKEQIISQRINHKGYLIVALNKNKKVTKTTHRIVCESFHADTYFENATVNHINQNKLDNNASNLEWVTIKENIQDYRKKVNNYVGINHPMARLSEKDVKNIREEYENTKIFQKDLAKKYKITQVMISKIITRKAWNHI